MNTKGMMSAKLISFIVAIVLLSMSFGGVAAQDETPVQGGTLTIATPITPGQAYIPQRMGSISQLQQIDSMFLRLVYGREWTEGLNAPTSGPIELGVAESVTVIEPNLIWEFTLRDDVFWHDGEPVTADDVIFGIWMSLNGNLPISIAAPKPNGILGGVQLVEEGSDEVFVEGATKIDDRTVRIELEQPVIGYWEQWGNAYYPMPMHVLGDNPEMAFELPFSNMPLGNGPFIPVAYEEEQFLELEANENFYLGRPNIDRLIFRHFASNEALWLGMEAEEIDGFFSGIPDENYARVTDMGFVDGAMMSMASPHGFKVNAERFPDEYAELHKAIKYALNGEFLSETYYNGALNLHNYNFIHTVGLENPPEGFPEYSYDPDRAREILEEIGWDSSTTLSWLAWYEPFEFHEAMAAMLADVGINVEFNRIDRAVVQQELNEESNWDIIYTSSYGGSDMRQMWDQFRCGADVFNAGRNNSGYCNEELDAIWEEALTATDDETYTELFTEVALMFAEDPPMATWNSPNVSYVWNERVRGAYPFQHFQPVRPALERVWLADGE